MTQQDLFQTATSYPVATLVSHLVRPGSDEARKMTAMSGRKYLPLCKQKGRVGLFAKMWLDTSVWASTRCYLTWKVKATPSSRLLFQLAPLMPRTDAIESGLWPAATTQDNPQVRGQGKTIGTNRGTTLGGAVRMWPTPVADDTGLRKKKYSQGGTPLSLAAQEPQMWATPTAAIAQGTTRPPTKGGGSRDLRQDVKMWPTPDVRGFTNQGALEMLSQKLNSNQEFNGMTHRAGRKKKSKMWPTPRASEYKDTGPVGSKSHTHRKDKGYLCAETKDPQQPSASLNPNWVEWLMGYPPGWTNLETSQE